MPKQSMEGSPREVWMRIRASWVGRGQVAFFPQRFIYLIEGWSYRERENTEREIFYLLVHFPMAAMAEVGPG